MRTRPSRHRVVLSAALSLVGAAAAAGAFAACRVSEITPAADAATRANLRPTDTATVARLEPVFATVLDKPASGTEPSSAARDARVLAKVIRDTPGVKAPIDSALAVKLAAAARSLPAKEGAAEKPYFEFRITRAATPAPGNQGPRYPDALREAKVEGEVLVQFVVDTNGLMLPGSLKVLRSDHDLFSKAVAASLETARFVPAEVEGRKVRQLLQLPFQFSLTK